MSLILIVAPLILAQVSWDVRTVDGGEIQGAPVLLTAAELVLQSGDRQQSISGEDILQIRRVEENRSPTVSKVVVRLEGGSRVFGVGFRSDGQNVDVTLAHRELTFLASEVRSVRFRTRRSELDKQWREILHADHDGDVLVIRKGTSSLAYLEGVVTHVSNEHVSFEFDGARRDVALAKLEGVLFYAAQRIDEVPAPVARVEMLSGTIWNVSDVTIENNQVQFVSVVGTKLKFPLSQLRAIDYGAGKVVYLSQVEPASVRVTPKFGSSIQDALNRLIYAPKIDVGFGGQPLQLFFPSENLVREYSQGLALHSRTEMSWRLAGRYRTLRAIVGPAPGVVANGEVQLVIRADGQTLFDELIGNRYEPIPIELNIQGRRRLEILVDYGDDSDVADRLYFCELKVIK